MFPEQAVWLAAESADENREKHADQHTPDPWHALLRRSVHTRFTRVARERRIEERPRKQRGSGIEEDTGMRDDGSAKPRMRDDQADKNDREVNRRGSLRVGKADS